MRKIVWVAALVLATSPALADFTFAPFSPGDVTPTWTGQSLAGAPAASYVSFEVLVDWMAVSGNPWSNEARVFFADVIGTGTATLPAGVGVSYTTGAVSPANGQSNGNPLFDMRFVGAFSAVYNGTDSLALNMRQTFSGSVADWQNVRVTLRELVVPTAIDLGTIGTAGATGSVAIAPGEVQWFKFAIDEVAAANGQYLSIDTLGSVLTGGSLANDTEIALYTAAGALIGNNDDFTIPPNPVNRESLLVYGDRALSPYADATGTGISPGDLPAGEYYLAVSGFNLTPNPFFIATSSAVTEGTIQVNLMTNVPEPASFLLVTLLGAFIRRR